MTTFAALALFAVAVAALMLAIDYRETRRRTAEARLDAQWDSLCAYVVRRVREDRAAHEVVKLTRDGAELLARERAGMLAGHEWGH